MNAPELNPLPTAPSVGTSDGPSSELSDRDINTTILLLSLAALGVGASLRVLDAALPKLAEDFGMALPAVANLATAFAVTYGLLQLFFGPMGDRFGKLRVISLACLGAALASIVCATSSLFPSLLVGRLLSGMMMAGVIPLCMAWIGDSVPYAQRQPTIARFLIGHMFGLAAGSALGGIAAQHFSWRLPFWGLAIWFAVVALLLGRRQRLHPKAAVPSSGGMVRQLVAVLQIPWARWVLLTVFLEGMGLYGPFTFFASHLHLKLGLTLTNAGLLVMFFAAGGLGFALSSKILVRRLGETGLPLFGGLVMASGMLTLAFTPLVWPAFPALFVIGVGFYMFHNTLQTNATQMAPSARGSAVALFASCFFLGQSAGVALSAVATASFGTTTVIATGALWLIAMGTGFAWLRQRRGQRE